MQVSVFSQLRFTSLFSKTLVGLWGREGERVPVQQTQAGKSLFKMPSEGQKTIALDLTGNEDRFLNLTKLEQEQLPSPFAGCQGWFKKWDSYVTLVCSVSNSNDNKKQGQKTCSSRCGTQTCSIRITKELFRSADSQAQPHTYSIRICILTCTKPR